MPGHVIKANSKKWGLRWRLRTLLVMVAFLAILLAVWLHFYVFYYRQHEASLQLAEKGAEIQTIGVRPSWIAKLDPERFVLAVQIRAGSPMLNDDSIAPITHLSNLKRAYFNRSHLGDEGMKYIARLEQLERLSLWRTHLTDDGLVPLANCKQLVALDIHETGVSDAGLAHLLKIPSLRELTLGSGVLGPGLVDVSKLPNLQQLDLSRSGVYYDQFHRLDGCPVAKLTYADDLPSRLVDVLPTLPNLELFASRFVGASDEDAESIARCRKLQEVNLIGSGISDQATQSLTQMNSIESITLSGDLTDRSLEVVANAKQPLRRVELSGRFSKEAIERLAMARPDLELTIRTELSPTQAQAIEAAKLRNLSVVPLLFLRPFFSNRLRPVLHWPGQIADLHLTPLGTRGRMYDLHTAGPPSVMPELESSGKVSWDLDEVAALRGIEGMWLERIAPHQLGRIAELSGLKELILDDPKLTDDELVGLKLPAGFRRLVITPCPVTRGGLAQLQARYPGVSMRVNGHGSLFDNDTRWQTPFSGQGSITDMLSMPQLETVQIEAIQRTLDLTPLQALTKLKSISVRGKVAHAPIWKLDEPLPNVTAFESVSASLDDRQFQKLNQFPQLEYLLTRKSTITDHGMKAFEALPNLQRLNFQSELMTGSGLPYLAHCPELKEVELISEAIKGRYLIHLQKLPELKELKIRNTPSLGDQACLHLSRIPSLTSLYLGKVAVSDEGLKHLGQSPKLETLIIESPNVTDEGLFELAKCASLRYVSIQVGRYQVTSKGVEKAQAINPYLEVR